MENLNFLIYEKNEIGKEAKEIIGAYMNDLHINSFFVLQTFEYIISPSSFTLPASSEK